MMMIMMATLDKDDNYVMMIMAVIMIVMIMLTMQLVGGKYSDDHHYGNDNDNGNDDSDDSNGNDNSCGNDGKTLIFLCTQHSSGYTPKIDHYRDAYRPPAIDSATAASSVAIAASSMS